MIIYTSYNSINLYSKVERKEGPEALRGSSTTDKIIVVIPTT